MLSGVMAFAMLTQGITGTTEVLELVSVVVASARRDAGISGADTVSRPGINLLSFTVLAAAAAGQNVSSEDVSIAIGQSFEQAGPSQAPVCDAPSIPVRPKCSMRFGWYLELNGMYVTPIQAEVIVTTKWITGTNRSNSLTLRTLRMRFVRRDGMWTKSEQIILVQS